MNTLEKTLQGPAKKKTEKIEGGLRGGHSPGSGMQEKFSWKMQEKNIKIFHVSTRNEIETPDRRSP